tara:strand:- start:11 stop:595 length:585 start_codon:yes stop_codon:yes gene_type:complete
MTQNERMKIFKSAWKSAISNTLYTDVSGNPAGVMVFLFQVAIQLFPDNNLVSSLDTTNNSKFAGDMRSMDHDAVNLAGAELVNFTDANDITESKAGSPCLYFHGQNSRLLKKTGVRLNSCLHLGKGYFLENAVGSTFTWDQYCNDNEFEPKLRYWYNLKYNPTIEVNGVYCRPNNIGDNNDEVLWRDFWDGLCP